MIFVNLGIFSSLPFIPLPSIPYSFLDGEKRDRTFTGKN